MDCSGIRYTKNFINQVIVRIDFLEFMSNDEIFDASIIREVKSFYGNKEKDQLLKFNHINIDDSVAAQPPNVSNNFIQGLQQTYTSADGKNKLILTNQFLVVEMNSYSTFEQMLSTFDKVLVAIFRKKPMTTNRIGIRYINMFNPSEIRINKNYFTPVVASSLSTDVVKCESPIDLIRSMHVAEYRINDINLNFRFGLFNKKYPSVIDENDFVLDYDCFTPEGFRSSDDTIRFITKGHDHIQQLFECSITDNLRRVMNNG